MRTLILAAFCAALIPTLATAAAAPPAEGVTADARCLLTMAALNSATDPSATRFGQIGAVYFAGRIKAHEPAFDFAARLKAIAAGMTNEMFQVEIKRCGPQVQTVLNQLDTAFQALSPAPAPTPAPTPDK